MMVGLFKIREGKKATERMSTKVMVRTENDKNVIRSFHVCTYDSVLINCDIRTSSTTTSSLMWNDRSNPADEDSVVDK